MNPAEYDAMYRVEDTMWWYVGMRAILRTVVGERLENARRVLDAGCGTGGTLAWWYRRAIHRHVAVVGAGIDLSPHALALGTRRGLTRLGRASVSALPFADRTFDGVFSLDVIYHLDVADDRSALAELARVTKPGGWACVRVPAFDALRSDHDVAVHTRERYRLPTLTEKIAQAGFAIDRATYANTVLFPAAVASRLLRRGAHANSHGRREREPVTSDVRPASALAQAIGGIALRAETAMLRYANLPIGLSAIVVATRPTDAT